MARKRRSTRRRSPSRGRAGIAGIVNQSTIMSVGSTAGGFIATNMIVNKLPFAQVQTGTGRMLAKAGVAIALGVVGGSVLRNKQLGTALAVGGLTSVALDAFNRTTGGGVAGLPSPGVAGYLTNYGGMGRVLPSDEDEDQLAALLSDDDDDDDDI